MEQHGIDIESVTKRQWDSIMWYEAAVMRKQRRDRRRSSDARRHIAEVFAEQESGKEEGSKREKQN